MSATTKIILAAFVVIAAMASIGFGAIFLPEAQYKFSRASIMVVIEGFAIAAAIMAAIVVFVMAFSFAGYCLRCWLSGGGQ